MITSATYDAANELTNWNGTPISYDLNGNMLIDGTNTFSWNARNQVASLNSVSLQHDGFGRRTKNLQNTSFLFDGANAVQELSGSTVLIIRKIKESWLLWAECAKASLRV